MPARARWSRQRSIRALLALGLVVPVVCLVVLWAFGTDVTMSHAGTERDFTAADRLYTGPDQELSSALAAEQLAAVTRLSGGAAPSLAALQARYGVTDQAAASFLAAARADQAVIPSGAEPALRGLESLLAGRPALRASVDAAGMSPLAAVQAYGAIATAVVRFDAKLLVTDDASLARQAAASVEAGHGVALVNSEIALISGAAAAGGAMSIPERALLAQDATGARLLLNDALTVLNPALGAGYRTARNSAAHQALSTAEGKIAVSVGRGGRVHVDTPQLAASLVPLSADYQTAQRQDATGLANLAARASGPATFVAVLVAGLGLVAVLLSLALAIWVWWRIVRDVIRLRDAALTPAAGQLAQPAEWPSGHDAGHGGSGAVPSPGGHVRELAQAGVALAAARQLTLQAVAAQSQLRTGACQLFRNLGLRSHALAQRQLRLLAVLERGISDPHALAGLAAVGQLTTRLQRQADGLLVLSGDPAARSGDVAQPIGDLLRAATSAVDDGSRVTVVVDSADAVIADAAADVLHLVTELVENAVAHTPPVADVTVRVGRVGRGLVVEVEDHGPGLAADDLESWNSLLAEPPDSGLAAGDGLGLLVAGRLAARHGITVSLRRSPIGGMTAIVLLPHAILITGELRDTIVDGSLRRIEGATRPALRASALTPGRAPSTEPEAAQSAPGPLPARADREPAATAATDAPVAQNLAPWHWLTESQPTPTSPPDPPGTPASGPRDGADPEVPAPLPRRIRRAASPADVPAEER